MNYYYKSYKTSMSKNNQHNKYKKIEKVFNDLLRFFYLTSDVAVGDRGIYLTVNYPDTKKLF